MEKPETPKDEVPEADQPELARSAKLPPDLNAAKLKPLRELRVSSPPNSTDFQRIEQLKK